MIHVTTTKAIFNARKVVSTGFLLFHPAPFSHPSINFVEWITQFWNRLRGIMASRLSPALFALLVFLGVYLTVVAANGATRRKKKIHHKKSSGTTDLDKLETETMPLHQAQMLDSRAKLGASRLAATFLKRARVTEMRATKLMRKPFPPGMSQLGNGFNAFNGKVTQGVISISC